MSMRLKSFRVVNCFGFLDSGDVHLDPRGGVVFVLGKNSSGKTSLLQALRHLESGLMPGGYRNFKNFKSSGEPSRLLAEFSVPEVLDTKRLATRIRERLQKSGVPEASMIPGEAVGRLLSVINQTYAGLFDDAVEAGGIRVEKYADGNYLFLLGDDRSAAQRRRTELANAINSTFPRGKLRVGPTTEISIDLKAEEVENELFWFFPQIVFFGERYSLIDDISDRITADNLVAPANEVESAFIDLLGVETIELFLAANDPGDRDALLGALRQKAKALCSKINRQASSLGDYEFVDIILHEKQGLQITIKANGKNSFYGQISANTKMLIAYHLHLMTKNINRGVLLFDEPNTGFHPSAQAHLMEFMRSVAKGGSQVILTTHSEHLIDLDALHAIRLMSADEQGMLSVEGHPYRPARTKGDLLSLQPITSAIGLRYGMGISLAKPLVLVEGITDLLYLRSARKVLSIEKEIAIAPARGDSNIMALLPFFIGQGIAFRIVIDAGGLRGKLQEHFEIPDEFIFEIPVPPEFVSNSSCSGIEDLFSRSDFLKISSDAGVDLGSPSKRARLQNSALVKAHPGKRIIPHELLGRINTEKVEFDKETTSNLRRVLEFCLEPSGFLL